MTNETINNYLNTLVYYYKSEQRPYVALDSAEELFNQLFNRRLDTFNTRIVIRGDAGSGKTTMLDHLSLKLSEKKIGIPIFVSLQNYTSNLSDLIDRSINRFVGNINFEDLIYSSNESELPIWILLDGLDEIAISLQQRFLSDLESIETKYNEINLVATIRSSSLIDTSFEKWEYLTIHSLTKNKVIEILSAKLDFDDISRVLARPDLLETISNPLMLNSILYSYKEKGNINEYIQDQIGLYAAWRGHTKSFLPPNIPITILNDILETIAFYMIQTDKVWLSEKETILLISENTDHNPNVIYGALAKMDPIQVDEDRIRFRHKSYKISYCSKLLLKQLDDIDLFIESVKFLFSKDVDELVIEDMFLEANNKQRKIILANISQNIIDYLSEKMPETVSRLDKKQQNSYIEDNDIISMLETLKSSMHRMDRRQTKIIVFTIHGFNTRGNWKNTFAPILSNETDGEKYIYHPWDYGTFIFGLFNSYSRKQKVKEFHDFYNKTINEYETRPEVCIVAHSFGTYIVGNAIKKFPEVKFDRIILLGSVLQCDFPWNDLGNRFMNVLNIIGRSDIALLFASFIPGLGSAGRDGFRNKAPGIYEHKEEFSDHSDLFGDNYMKNIWIPFLRDGELP